MDVLACHFFPNDDWFHKVVVQFKGYNWNGHIDLKPFLRGGRGGGERESIAEEPLNYSQFNPLARFFLPYWKRRTVSDLTFAFCSSLKNSSLQIALDPYKMCYQRNVTKQQMNYEQKKSQWKQAEPAYLMQKD